MSTAAPPLFARIIAVVAIVLAGLCGGLIGYAVMDLQCTDGCTTYAGLVGIGAAILAAGGVAIVAVLTLRAMSEWEAVEAARADDVSADLAELLALAQAAVDAVAPGLAAPDARGDLGIDTKSSPTDMVTAMDRWAEETIVGVLLDARPDDGLLGEEGADKTSETGVIWVIDPIDGTTNFIRDLPGFSVSIAARVDGVDSVGVVHDLVRSERFTATLGSGAFCNGEAIHVSEPVDLARAVLGTGFNYQPTVRAEQARLIANLLPDIADIRRFGGLRSTAAASLRRLDAYYEVGVQEWDIAAGGLLVREAGGRTLDHRPDGPSFVAPSPSSKSWSVGWVSPIDFGCWSLDGRESASINTHGHQDPHR